MLKKAENPTQGDGFPEILAISGHGREELQARVKQLRGGFSANADVAAVFADLRRSFASEAPCRLLMVVESSENPQEIIDQAISALETNAEPVWSDRHLHYGEGPCPGGLAFAFPGQGSQYVGMGKDLVQTFAEAKDIFSRADAAFDPDRRLSDLIFPEASEDGDATLRAEDTLRSTDVAQPAIGAVSAVMMRILKGFGITPAAVCGHSYGEIAALFAAGRLDEKKFFELSVARGKFMARAGGQGDKGGMLAVKAPMDVLEALIQESGLDVVLANRNSPDQGVLSGPTQAIAAMKDLCREKKLRATILPVAAAFHSRLVAAAAAPFADTIAAARFHETGLPVYSNTTGKPYPLGADAAKSLLSGHLMHPVRFVEEIESMYRDGVRIFLEVGPRAVLTGLIKAILKDRPAHALAVDASSGRHNGLADLARALCGMAALGYPVRLAEWKKSET